jgi:hypothetical protein
MKKLFSVAAIVLAAGLTAGLTGCSGCSSTTKNTAITTSNWYTGTSYKGIQPSTIYGDDPAYTKEVIHYTITNDTSDASNNYYSAEYTNGSYTTEFYAARYDWTSSNIPESFKAEKTDDLVYVFKTTLNISVKFKIKSSGEESETFEDSVQTISMFRSAGDNLQPVYSKQEIVSHSPSALQPTTLSAAYSAVNITYENFYDSSCSHVLTRTTESSETSEKTVSFGKHSNSLFDNSSLYIAIRSLNLSSDLSQSIDLYSAAQGGSNKYTLTGSDEQLPHDEGVAVTKELTAHGLYTPTAENESIESVQVQISYASGSLVGTTQQVWYAAISNADNNTPRATMLKIATPLSYGLGTLEYTLSSIESTLWNK